MKEEKQNKKCALFSFIFGNHFRKNGPFYFRIDSLMIVCVILIGFVSFGIAANFAIEKNNIGIDIVNMIFDLWYTALRILAFGGLLSFFRIVFIFKYKNEYKILQEDTDGGSNEESFKSLQFKMNQLL